MNTAKEKLIRWLQEHPDDWLKESFKEIGKQSGVSATSVDRYLPELIAERDGIMPSAVMRQREEAGFVFRGRSKADTSKIRECINEHPDADIRDIAYLAKCTPKAVKRVMDEMEQEHKYDETADNNSESSSDTHSEMAKLEAEFEERRAALLKNSK